MISRGHTPGVYYYHGKDGKIVIDDKNIDSIRRDAEELSKESYVNIMAQYYPQFEAAYYPELNRRITPQEYREVVVLARSFGLHRGFPEM